MDRAEFFRLARNDTGNGFNSVGMRLSANASTLFRGSYKRIKGCDFFINSNDDMDYCIKYERIYLDILIANLEDYSEESYQKLLKTLIIRRKLRDIDLEFK